MSLDVIIRKSLASFQERPTSPSKEHKEIEMKLPKINFCSSFLPSSLPPFLPFFPLLPLSFFPHAPASRFLFTF